MLNLGHALEIHLWLHTLSALMSRKTVPRCILLFYWNNGIQQTVLKAAESKHGAEKKKILFCTRQMMHLSPWMARRPASSLNVSWWVPAITTCFRILAALCYWLGETRCWISLVKVDFLSNHSSCRRETCSLLYCQAAWCRVPRTMPKWKPGRQVALSKINTFVNVSVGSFNSDVSLSTDQPIWLLIKGQCAEKKILAVGEIWWLVFNTSLYLCPACSNSEIPLP